MNALRILATCLVFCSLQSFGQAKLEKYFESLRRGNHEPVPEEILKNRGIHQQALSTLAKYESDSIASLRYSAYSLARRIGLASPDVAIRQQSISQLINGIGDQDGGISGACISGLTGFRLSDFSIDHKQSLTPFLATSTQHLDDFVKLIGFLQMRDQVPVLDQLLSETPDTKTKWSIRIAMTRLGDAASASSVVNKLSTAPISDDFVYDIVPDLIYTRNEPVFDFLQTLIADDDPKCTSSNPDRDDVILCGYRVMEYIAYSIKDFPIVVDAFNEPQISDYEKALTDVRAWFASHPSYQFNLELF